MKQPTASSQAISLKYPFNVAGSSYREVVSTGVIACATIGHSSFYRGEIEINAHDYPARTTYARKEYWFPVELSIMQWRCRGRELIRQIAESGNPHCIKRGQQGFLAVPAAWQSPHSYSLLICTFLKSILIRTSAVIVAK
jgi:hypothetical protein